MAKLAQPILLRLPSTSATEIQFGTVLPHTRNPATASLLALTADPIFQRTKLNSFLTGSIIDDAPVDFKAYAVVQIVAGWRLAGCLSIVLIISVNAVPLRLVMEP